MIVDKKVNMVPIGSLELRARADRARKLRKYYKVDGVLAFVHIRLLDTRSQFLSRLEITVRQEDGQYLLEASQALAKANAVASFGPYQWSRIFSTGAELFSQEEAPRLLSSRFVPFPSGL